MIHIGFKRQDVATSVFSDNNIVVCGPLFGYCKTWSTYMYSNASLCLFVLRKFGDCTSQICNSNCSSCSFYSYKGVLETVARRVTKKNETKDNKYAANPLFVISARWN